MSQIRYDLFKDRYVIMAPNRAQRPGFLQPAAIPQAPTCPFCEGNESLTPHEIYALRTHTAANTTGWLTRVVPNLYKAVQIEANQQHHKEGSFEWQGGFGAHEIVIDMPRHELRMDQWSAQEYANWLLTLQERVIDLHRDFRIVYLSVFKNHGLHAGATQAHPHTQILGLPLIPKRELFRLQHHVTYYRQHGHAIAEVARDDELREGKRVIVQNAQFAAIVPYGSAFPFEVWVTPRFVLPSMLQMDNAQIDALSALLKEVFARLYAVLGVFDFNLSLEMAPLQKDGASEALFDDFAHACRFGIRIQPRITGIGGFELATDMHINPVLPEEAAEKLRRAKI